MSHSENHKRQKELARAEALEHLKSSVMHPRDGKGHEDHKERDLYNRANIDTDKAFRGTDRLYRSGSPEEKRRDSLIQNTYDKAVEHIPQENRDKYANERMQRPKGK